MQSNFDNAGWVEKHLKRTLTPFQRRVADIVGIIGANAYNAPVKWENVKWEYGFAGVSLVWGNGHLSTFDFQPLTTLVFLCHDARIRLQIEPAGPRGLRLCFWQRKAQGGISKWHPDLDEAVASHREFVPHTHPLLYFNHPEREAEREAEKAIATLETEAEALKEAAAKLRSTDTEDDVTPTNEEETRED